MTPLLYRFDNPHAPVRANGRRFWGYPTRVRPVTALGIHTTENHPLNSSAFAVGLWQARTAAVPSSYGEIYDRGAFEYTLPDEATSFSIAGANSWIWSFSFVHHAAWWGRFPQAEDAMLRVAAPRVAMRCRRWGIPARRITAAQARAGVKGIVTHAAMDPGRRSDPGAGFPWARFLPLVQQHLSPQPRPPEVDELTPELREYLQDMERRIVSGVVKHKRRDGEGNLDTNAWIARTRATAAHEAVQQLRADLRKTVLFDRDLDRDFRVIREAGRAAAAKLGIRTRYPPPDSVDA